MDSDQSDTHDITDSYADLGSTGDHSSPEGRDNIDNDRPSAIERQRAAMQPTATRLLTNKETRQPKRNLRNRSSDDGHNSSRLVRRTRFAVILAAASLVLALIVFRIPIMGTLTQAERSLAQFTKPLQKAPAPITANDSVSGITIPISDVSLRVRPELLQQLVAIFRLRLANAPHNAELTATLARLREHSLGELDVISATEDPTIAADSLKLISKLFPELINDRRYQSLAAHINENTANRAAVAAVAAGQPTLTETPILSAQSAQSLPPAATTTTQQLALAPDAKSIPPAPMPAVSPSTELPMASAPKTAEAVVALKPEIHVISLTPGIIEADRFVPTEGGNVFLLAINYRNLGNGDKQTRGELVTQLGNSNNRRLLAEVPVEITGSKGTKNFLIGTFEKGRTGEAYKLNFILDGRALPTRTAHLSLSSYAVSDI